MNLISHFIDQCLTVPIPDPVEVKLHNDKKPNKWVGKSEHKWCRRCETYKQIGLFNKSPSHSDGHMSYCRVCTCAMQVERRRRNARR